MHSNGWRKVFFSSWWTDSAYPLPLGHPWFFPVSEVYPTLIFLRFQFPFLNPRVSLSPQVCMLSKSQASLRRRISFAHNSNPLPNHFQFSTPDFTQPTKPLPNLSGIQHQLHPSRCNGPTHSQLWWSLRTGSHFHSLPSLLWLHCETSGSWCVE